MITKEEVKYKFPKVDFWFDGKFQFTIDNEPELNNIRIVALQKDCCDKCQFVFNTNPNSIILALNNNGELSEWPVGMYDALLIQFGSIFRYRKSKDKSDLKVVIA